VQTHGHVRTTNDADLIPAPDPANLERLATALCKGALHVQLGGLDVPVVGLDDLIQMKLARGRRVDLDDVPALADPEAVP